MPALMALTTLDLADKLPDQARKRLEEVVQRNAKHVPAMIVLAELNARNGGAPDQTLQWLTTAVGAAPTDPVPRVKLIDQLLKLQRLDAAEQAAQAAVTSFPSDPDLLTRLGQVQQRRGATNQAVVTYTKLATLLPKSPEPLLRLAEAQAAVNDLPKAAASVRAALALAPADPTVLRAAALLAQSEGRPDQALALARRLQGQQRMAGLLLEGGIAAQQGQWPQAVAAYRQVLALAPETDNVLRLHEALQAAGMNEDAQRLAADWRKRNPKDLAFVLALGDRAMSRRQWSRAEEFYRTVLAAQPAHLLAMNNLAYLLVVQNKPGGLAMAEQAVQLAPDVVHFQDTLAFCLAADKQLARAIEVQTQVVERAPGVPEYRLQLARFQLKAGDKAAALGQLQQLQALGKRFPRQPEVQAMLASARS
jgi:putative PEP-CTERM system TPR-repeat lipoprotein